SKNLGAWGDGGMMVTSDAGLAERLRKLRLHGGAKQYHHDEVGTNSRLDTLQAAVLLAKLPHLAGWSARRREHAAYYAQGLAGLTPVTVPAVDSCNEHIFHQYTVRVERRDALQAHLKSKGIGSAIYYPVPLHLQNCFSHLGYQRGAFPEAERAGAGHDARPAGTAVHRGRQALPGGEALRAQRARCRSSRPCGGRAEGSRGGGSPARLPSGGGAAAGPAARGGPW